ncbi:MAG: hypothetical protein ACTHMP_15085 [Thermomicrobiales bacterium]
MTRLVAPAGADMDALAATLAKRFARLVAVGYDTDMTPGTLAVYLMPDLAAADITPAQQLVAMAAPPDPSARSLVVQTAQTAVGVRYDQLTAAQVRALFAIVLWQAGGLNADGTVRPLAAWVRN